MPINLSSIIKSEGETMLLNEAFAIPSFNYNGTKITITSPAKVSGEIKNFGNNLTLNANVNLTIIINCDRCTKEIFKDFSFNISETISKQASIDNSDDYIILLGNELNIEEIIINNIIINMSMKYLCSENCKGICPICGKNLNENICNCTKKEIDPRLEVLKKLLK